MREARKREVWESTSWKKVRGLAGAVFFLMKVLGVTLASWQVLRLQDGRLINMKNTCPEDVKKTSHRLAREACWTIGQRNMELKN